MKILIIGGSGFIGPYLVRDLLKEGHTVALFNRGRSSAQTPPSISRIYGDRKDLPSFSEELKRIAPEVVIDTVAFTESDALGAVEAFKDCTPRMVVLSSMDVYLAYDRLRGIPGTPSCAVPLTEESELRTNLYPYRAQAEGEDDFLRDYEKILVERTYSKVVDPLQRFCDYQPFTGREILNTAFSNI
jgi:nucleoside-diphosphate-sugar epimerase